MIIDDGIQVMVDAEADKFDYEDDVPAGDVDQHQTVGNSSSDGRDTAATTVQKRIGKRPSTATVSKVTRSNRYPCRLKPGTSSDYDG